MKSNYRKLHLRTLLIGNIGKEGKINYREKGRKW